MIPLVDKVICAYRVRILAWITPYPFRETKISIDGGTMQIEEMKQLNAEIAAIIDFVENDPDPWNNSYAV